MKCPRCNHADTRVIDSRELDEGNTTRRRRECPYCQARFTTYERSETASIVVKKDGRREAYSREKLARGIRKAVEKRPLSNDVVEAMILGIEQRIFQTERTEVKSHVVGELVLDALKGLDPVAYIRFASVYVGYADLETMRREVDALLRMGSAPSETQPVSSPTEGARPLESSRQEQGA